MNHSERAHSKFSASGAERWLNCPGSVALSEGQPDKSSIWAEEGTKAHEVLELILKEMIKNEAPIVCYEITRTSKEMISHGQNAAEFIFRLFMENKDSEILVESKVHLDFIHPEMFGTYDGAVVDHFGTLHVFDYKYGAGHAVSPKKNLQMIFYGIGLAHKFDWNFKSVRLWIIQPRIKGYDGPLFWDISMAELKDYVRTFKWGVDRVRDFPYSYTEGQWCHWCKAKSVCPLKQTHRIEKGRQAFLPVLQKGTEYGQEEKAEIVASPKQKKTGNRARKILEEKYEEIEIEIEIESFL